MFSGNEIMKLGLDPAPLIEMISTMLDDKFEKLEMKLTSKNRVLTREEAAKRLNVQPNTISQYVKNGRLNNSGVGKKILILESDLLKLKK